MPENISVILDSSNNPRQLTQAAATLAHSDSRADHLQLLAHLQSQEFLLRMDSAKSYLGTPKALNLRRVLEELSRGKPEAAHATLIALTQNEPFISEPARADLLITACAAVRPAPPEVVKFWDAHCLPEDGFGNLTVEALVNNGSPPAVALLAAKLRDARFEEEEKINWIRSSILTHRNDAPLLAACEDLLKHGLSESLRLALAESLFDYKPYEWFTPATVLHPPPRAAIGPEARATLQRIADFVLANLKLPEDLAAKIRAELETLRQGQRPA
jgi:hypothetical protein